MVSGLRIRSIITLCIRPNIWCNLIAILLDIFARYLTVYSKTIARYTALKWNIRSEFRFAGHPVSGFSYGPSLRLTYTNIFAFKISFSAITSRKDFNKIGHQSLISNMSSVGCTAPVNFYWLPTSVQIFPPRDRLQLLTQPSES